MVRFEASSAVPTRGPSVPPRSPHNWSIPTATPRVSCFDVLSEQSKEGRTQRAPADAYEPEPDREANRRRPGPNGNEANDDRAEPGQSEPCVRVVAIAQVAEERHGQALAYEQPAHESPR